ncbi:hypothetical protein [Fibrella forsythiae]|uniref:Uncharacterized protein n=1 Tax=Fibrella forsythiae TaxID=2817061 RepID=A0ABS3JTF1_9BACT|nr:hypothetical protein [Fibrella forsythiae]MBO0953228.1 hypothetical protein [Fibrella forsythiae]
MNSNSKQNKSDFFKLIVADLEFSHCNRQESDRYLADEGLNRDSIINEGMKRVKQMRLKMQSLKTQEEMNSTEYIKNKAIVWVEDLLKNVNFSFPEFAISEKLILHNRNIESFTEEDIKVTLVKYFYLKFTENEDKNVNE